MDDNGHGYSLLIFSFPFLISFDIHYSLFDIRYSFLIKALVPIERIVPAGLRLRRMAQPLLDQASRPPAFCDYKHIAPPAAESLIRIRRDPPDYRPNQRMLTEHPNRAGPRTALPASPAFTHPLLSICKAWVHPPGHSARPSIRCTSKSRGTWPA